MVCNKEERQKKRAVLHEKLQLLRSITTNSHSVMRSGNGIIMDASKYITELKQKVERLNDDDDDIATSSHDQNPFPVVRVETEERGFVVDVFAAESCPGLLVFILEAFDGIGLDVLEARVSCTHTFQFQAVGGQEEGLNMDAGAVKEAVREAVEKWTESSS